MTFYVDNSLPYGFKIRGRYYKSCHLYTDGTTEDLINFAQKIGMKPEWLHKHRDMDHFDLIPSMRTMAIKAGAKEVDIRFTAKFMKGKK